MTIFDNIIVRLVPLPDGVNGLVSISDDDYYNVYLSQRLTYEQQQETLNHELIHIARGDFAQGATLSVIENM